MGEGEARELARDIDAFVSWVEDAHAVELATLDLGPGWAVVVRFKSGKHVPQIVSVLDREDAVANFGADVNLRRA